MFSLWISGYAFELSSNIKKRIVRSSLHKHSAEQLRILWPDEHNRSVGGSCEAPHGSLSRRSGFGEFIVPKPASATTLPSNLSQPAEGAIPAFLKDSQKRAVFRTTRNPLTFWATKREKFLWQDNPMRARSVASSLRRRCFCSVWGSLLRCGAFSE